MIECNTERYSAKLNFLNGRIDFNAKNPEHRKAAIKFFRDGVWEIKFNAKWPYVTVPQTVLMLLAEHACQKELKELAKAEGIEMRIGDPFNLHTYRPLPKKISKIDPANSLDYKKIGASVANFINENRDAFIGAGEMLDASQKS